MSEWLQTYNEMFGMYHAGIITTIFGAFAVTFTVLMSWPKLVKDFGPIGGFMAAALIIGTFWLVNHKLPGFGFSTGLLNDADGLHCRRNLRRPYRIHECGTLIQLTEKENIKCIY